MVDKKTWDKVLTEIEKTGIILHACRKAGIDPSTFHRQRKKSKKFSQQVEESMEIGRANMSDIGESALLRKVQEGEFAAIKYMLVHNSERYKARQQDTFKYEFDYRSNKAEKTEHVGIEDILARMAQDSRERAIEQKEEDREKLLRDIDHALPYTSTGDPIPPWEVRVWEPQISEWREKVREAFKNGTPFPSDIMKPLDINLDSISIEDPPPPKQIQNIKMHPKRILNDAFRRDPVGDGD